MITTKIYRSWGYAWAGMMALLLFCFFRFYLRLSLLVALYWLMGLFLTGLFPFQLFTPALFRSIRHLPVLSIGLWGQALGLVFLLVCFQRLDTRDSVVLHSFYLFPTLSSILGSLLLLQANHFRDFLACSGAVVGGFLVLNMTTSSLFPLFGFRLSALAMLLILHIASALGTEKNEMQGKDALVGLFHHHPQWAFAWLVSLLSLSGLFPSGHSWQWQVLATFYHRHSQWICFPLLGSMILSAVVHFHWIHAAIHYPHGRQTFPVFQAPKAQTAWAILLAVALCLSWFSPHHGC
ncbi:MAG: hypothetical protein LBT57_00800 [Puniceicoccales bacterium]|jgi:NADH:ubiquinone oxidoreductase subunit 2 (subunit N)|nr:hypothetical protein [Puniceicoccales bacterium]